VERVGDTRIVWHDEARCGRLVLAVFTMSALRNGRGGECGGWRVVWWRVEWLVRRRFEAIGVCDLQCVSLTSRARFVVVSTLASSVSYGKYLSLGVPVAQA
jgi:hypothetical protein